MFWKYEEAYLFEYEMSCWVLIYPNFKFIFYFSLTLSLGIFTTIIYNLP